MVEFYIRRQHLQTTQGFSCGCSSSNLLVGVFHREKSLQQNMEQQQQQQEQAIEEQLPLQSASFGKPDEKEGAGDQKDDGKMDDMLEECWFFDNLLLRRTRYSRSNSDPCPASASSSSISNQAESAPSVSEVYAEIIKQEKSMEETVEATADMKITKLSVKNEKQNQALMMRQSLLRAPSLPTNMGMGLKETPQEDVSSVPKLSRLNRQTSLTPNLLPSRKQGHARGRITRAESLNVEAINEMRKGYVNYQKNTRKTASDLEFEEVQGFKDLGFNFDTKDLNPNVVSILPGLQEKNKATMSNINEEGEEEQAAEDDNDSKLARRKPYLSEAWQVQRSTPTISNWVVKKSSDDMKAQLKSWARTVASNVR